MRHSDVLNNLEQFQLVARGGSGGGGGGGADRSPSGVVKSESKSGVDNIWTDTGQCIATSCAPAGTNS